MTFQEIYTECVNLRFNTQTVKLAQVKKWVNQAEIALWNAADWNFKRMPATEVTVSAAGAMTEPADFDRAIRVWDSRGDEIPYMNPEDFEDIYVVAVPTPTGNAEFYTVINRSVLIGPPEASTKFKLSYQRRYSHLDTAVATLGVMDEDTDTPIWDAEHHYILVPWAIRIGKYLEDDPTAAMLDQVIGGLTETSMFRAMVEQLATDGTKKVTRYWGAQAGVY